MSPDKFIEYKLNAELESLQRIGRAILKTNVYRAQKHLEDLNQHYRYFHCLMIAYIEPTGKQTEKIEQCCETVEQLYKLNKTYLLVYIEKELMLRLNKIKEDVLRANCREKKRMLKKYKWYMDASLLFPVTDDEEDEKADEKADEEADEEADEDACEEVYEEQDEDEEEEEEVEEMEEVEEEEEEEKFVEIDVVVEIDKEKKTEL